MRFFPLLLLFGTFSAGFCGEQADSARPNLILISIDDLSADHLGCYGYDRNTSRFLDSLSREGVLFEKTTAQETWTLPSHASMLTSRYESAHGVWNHSLRLGVAAPLLLQERLKEARYRTAGFAACPYVSKTYGFDRGFDHFSSCCRKADELNQELLDYLSHHEDEPFFLFLHYYDVHEPFVEKNPYGEDFARGRMDAVVRKVLRLKGLVGRPFSSITTEDQEWLDSLFADVDVPAILEDEANCDARISKDDIFNLVTLYFMKAGRETAFPVIGAYDNGIAYFDKKLEDLFEKLKTFPWFENTIFVITSDHGEAFNQHAGVFGHGGPPYRELVHIPLIFYGPGVPAERRVSSTVASIDIAPTLLDLAGAAPGEDFQGVSLAPYFGGEKVKPRPILSASSHSRMLCIQEGCWKLMLNLDDGKSLLFDNRMNPAESKDLSAEHPEEAKRLKKKLLKIEKINQRAAESLAIPKADLSEEDQERLRELGYL